jgi:hypothetical protein
MLAQLHHHQRGLPQRRYKVWTVLHNFDCRAADGTTPAAIPFMRASPTRSANTAPGSGRLDLWTLPGHPFCCVTGLDQVSSQRASRDSQAEHTHGGSQESCRGSS